MQWESGSNHFLNKLWKAKSFILMCDMEYYWRCCRRNLNLTTPGSERVNSYQHGTIQNCYSLSLLKFQYTRIGIGLGLETKQLTYIFWLNILRGEECWTHHCSGHMFSLRSQKVLNILRGEVCERSQSVFRSRVQLRCRSRVRLTAGPLCPDPGTGDAAPTPSPVNCAVCASGPRLRDRFSWRLQQVSTR